MYFFGLEKKYDVVNDNPRFAVPNFNIILFASINMFIIAFMGIIVQWSPLWLVTDLSAPIYLVGSIVIFFNAGEIIGNIFASRLIKKFNELIVGPCFAMVGSIILLLSIKIDMMILYKSLQKKWELQYGFLRELKRQQELKIYKKLWML